MGSNLLITGAAGYIGGSLAAHLRRHNSDLIQIENITVAVRSQQQAESLAKQDINVVQLDLSDEHAVNSAVMDHKIDLVVHCASGFESRLAVNLIKALGKRREASQEPTYFIHTSGASAFSIKSGWPSGLFKDTDPVFETEKRLADSNPLRNTDVTVIEQAKVHGVTSVVVVPPLVYGRGGGEWNKLSVCIPRYIKASISHKKVYKFPENVSMPATHISDLMSLYTLLIENILVQNKGGKEQHDHHPPIVSKSNNEQNYIFAISHQYRWWQTLDRLATILHAKDLVTDPTPSLWPSEELAAESFGLPVPFVHTIWNSETNITSDKHEILGWSPAWNSEAKFIENLDDEVRAVFELDSSHVKYTIFNALGGGGSGSAVSSAASEQ